MTFQNSAFEVCGSSLDPRSRTRGQASAFKLWVLAADPKTGVRSTRLTIIRLPVSRSHLLAFPRRLA